jgi:hopanoid biosynthesis associated radical SAM protein HpnJ
MHGEKVMLRTLFLNPPSYKGFDGGAGSRYQACREIRSFWYPTWLAYPAAMIEGSRLLDAPPQGMDLDEVLRQAHGYELIIVYSSTPTIRNDIHVAQRLKASYPDTMIGFVGAHVMVRPEETLMMSEAVDFVTTGEFDYAVPEIADGIPLDRVDGVAFRSKGKIVRTQDRPLIQVLDALPFVTDVYARDLRVEDYFIGYLQHPYVSLYTGRGCRSRCTFCLWPQTIGGHAYRVRSPDNVYREMVQARQRFPQVKEFFFDDDTFTEDLDRAEAISRKIGTLGIRWSCNVRANVPARTLRVMKENGLRMVVVGFESGNQKILNNVKKGIRLSVARQFVRDAKKLGILIHGTFIVGLPGETHETIEETIRFAQEIDPYSIQVSLVAPYPGTELYRQAVEEGWMLKTEDLLVQKGIQDVSLSYNGLSNSEVFDAVERFYRRFYLRPKPVLRILKDMVQDRHLFARRMREGWEFFSFLAKRKEILDHG